MIRPNLFIVGAAKSGTTTLYHYLEKHSQVFMPEDELYKEPAFFSSKGEKMGLEKYLDIFRNANENHKYIGEASTAYITDENSAKKIYDFNKESKIIIILRNPVKRAYSLYNWMVQEGYEYSKSFESALEKEKTRKNKKIPNFWEPEYYWNYMYFESGLYYKQVKRYFDLFNHNNIKVLIFENFIKDTQKAFIDTCSFLDIKYEKIDIRKENESKDVLHPWISFIGRKVNNNINRLQEIFMGINNKRKRDFLVYRLQKNKKVKKLNDSTATYLKSLYQKDIEQLERFLNTDLSIWKN